MALRGIRVIEMAGLIPAPFCGMILSDFGARVIRVDRPNSETDDKVGRGKQSIIVDLKKPGGVDIVKRLCRSADVFIEPYRAGVVERLGLGPDILMKDNPRLVYARLSGFGQSGPLASSAGHDINYVAMSGLLSLLGRNGERPYPPINFLADLAGGGLLCALGILMSLFERHSSGLGQVVDNSMTHGTAYVGTWAWTSWDLSRYWGSPRGNNLIDGGCAYYDVYETQDGKFMSVGPLESHFFQALLEGLNISSEGITQMTDQTEMRQKFQEVFKTKSRAEWTETFSKLDACVQPVLEIDEAPQHPHNRLSNTFMQNPHTGKPEPVPAPHLSRTPGVQEVVPQPRHGQDTVSVLEEAGLGRDEITRLLSEGVVMTSKEKSHL